MSASLQTVDDDALVEISAGHPLVRHLVPHRIGGRPGWAYGAAVGLLYDYWNPDGDLMVVGPPGDAAALTVLLAEHGRPTSLPANAFPLVPPGVLIDPHLWGFRWIEAPVRAETDGVAWIDADAEVTALLDEAFPDASSRPGEPRIRRWAGIRDTGGRLIACAADTTEAPGIGFVAAITSRQELRGQGLGRRVTAWTLNQLLATEGLAALWHYGGNHAAARVYDVLAMQSLPMMAATAS